MISRIHLDSFRNYLQKDFNFNTDISVIFGNNGVGKTNILEAISLFRKGKGLRSLDLEDMVSNRSINGKFAVYCELDGHDEISNLATSYDKHTNKRIFQVNGGKASKVNNFPAIIWLTPKMDTIFTDGKSLRRKFLDKIVSDIDSNHSSRVNQYEKCLRERMILLQNHGDKNWLSILERKISELGVAIAIARNEAVEYLNKAISQSNSNFIKTEIKIVGEVEELALNKTSIEVEEFFVSKIQQSRSLDLDSGRSLFGIHKTDFTANLLNKSNISANFCSTGEQKSILIAITIARVRINSFFNLPKPILLLDEIASHLDDYKRSELFLELHNIDSQSFLTGTNQDIFSNLNNYDQKTVGFLEIS